MFRKIKNLVKNPYALSLITKIFSVLVGFFFTVFQARFLGAEIKGQVATVSSMLQITAIVFSIAIHQAYPYYKRNTEEDILPVFMKIALLFLVFYGAVAGLIIGLFTLPAKYIAVMVITPLFVYDRIVSDLTQVEAPNKKSLTDMIVMLGELIFVIILWRFSEPTFFIGVIVIAIKDMTRAAMCTFLWRKRIFVHSQSIRKWLPKLLKFSFFPMLTLLMSALSYRIDVIMLDGRVPDAAIGVYSIGIAIAERIWMIPDAMRGVMLSHLARGKDETETAFVIRMSNTGCLLLIIAIIALGKPFINIFFGAEYQEAYPITMLIIMGAFSMIYYKLISAYNIAMGKRTITFVLLTISVVVNMVVNWFLVPVWGIYGAGAASLISYSLCGIMFIIFFCHTIHVPFKDMLIIKRSDLARVKQLISRKQG
ncbi:MAG: polysaccharide biosynthesis C-terminal domain-containing protein [Lachnospiraceae bacterium]|jgi:O-antigen/teichoic acid export membrane protein